MVRLAYIPDEGSVRGVIQFDTSGQAQRFSQTIDQYSHCCPVLE